MVLIRYLCGINQIKTVMEKLSTGRYMYTGPVISVYALGDKKKDNPPHELFDGIEVEAEVNINIATVTAYFTDDGKEEITVGIDPVDVAAKYLVPVKPDTINFKDDIDVPHVSDKPYRTSWAVLEYLLEHATNEAKQGVKNIMLNDIDKLIEQLETRTTIPQDMLDKLKVRDYIKFDGAEVDGNHYQTAIQPWDYDGILKQLSEIHSAKNHDYKDSFHELFDECGMTYAYGHLKEKLNRVKALKEDGAKVKGESMIDSLMDLASYAVMTIVELKQNEKKA